MFTFRNLRQIDPKIRKLTTQIVQLSTRKNFCVKAESLESVPLSYASYEGTDTVTDEKPPPLIIMHGLFGSKSNWNSLCKVYHQKTIPQRKIIAIDARNHGDSPHHQSHTYELLALDVKTLLDNMSLTKAAFLGHSMGGRALMMFALKYPELVEKLIIADISPVRTSPNLQSMPGLFDALRSVNLPKDVPMSQARLAADRQLSQSIKDKSLRAFLLTNLVQRPDGSYNWRVNIPALLANFQNIASFPDLPNVQYTGPVLFVGGGSSDYIKVSDHEEILQLFPKAKFRYIDGAGHWLHSEKPSEFLQITIEFLNSSNFI